MKIAYYGRGNVNDPLGIIHDENGCPLLEPGECILTKENVKCCRVTAPRSSSRTWSTFFRTPVFEDAGDATIYRTNQRLICIREPQPLRHLGTPTCSKYATAGDYFVSAPWAKEWKQKGRKECFSLSIKEIVGYKWIHSRIKRFQGIKLYIATNSGSNEERYIVVIGEDPTTIDKLLGEILTQKKICDNLG